MLTHIDQESKELIHYLKLLQDVHPSEKLRKQLEQATQKLPVQKQGWYMPLAFVQLGIVACVLLFIIIVGSGVVVASQVAEKGQPFSVVSQTVKKFSLPFVHKNTTPTVVPISPAKLSVTPSVQKSGWHKTDGVGFVIHKAVEAGFDLGRKYQQQNSNSANHAHATRKNHVQENSSKRHK